MPLTEFLRMSKGKVDATQLRGFTSDDTSCRPNSDCVELVWENGQITMQGQPSKGTRRVPNSSILPTTVIPKAQDNSRIGNVSKMSNKLSTIDSMLGDFSLPVPSYEGGGLDQDVEMAPWLNYTVEEDSLHNEYTSDFLRELSGVTINDLPTENHLASREKKSGFFNSSVVDNMENVKHGNSSKSFSSVEKHSRGEGSEVPQFLLPFHNNFSRSGILGVTGNTTSKLDGGQPSTTSSGITNFPYFSRPGFIPRANHPTVSDANRLEIDGKGCTLSSSGGHANSSLVDFSSGCIQKDIVSHNQSLFVPVNGNSESLPPMPREELLSSNQASVCGEDVNVKKNASQDQAHGMVLPKPIITEEKNKEPVGVATSSVCSGNSVERASNECARDLKRKSRETTECDGPSDEADEESIGATKAGPHRSGAKRGRAAEVHNQSERRRRDRINEKMRALQELIPNCNKVDKASMLDEAIEYLKTLQLQVQMLSMGTGMYMHPMMVPSGMQPIHGAQMPQFSPAGVGMGIGVGFGMNMLDVNAGMKLMPFQGAQYPVPGPQYPVPGTGPAFHVMGGSNLNPFGHPSQGVPMPMQRPHILPVSGIPPLKMPMVANVSGVAAATNAVLLGASSNPTDVASPSAASNNAKNSVNPASNQVTNEGMENPRQSCDQAQTGNDATHTAGVATSTTDNMPS